MLGKRRSSEAFDDTASPKSESLEERVYESPRVSVPIASPANADAMHLLLDAIQQVEHVRSTSALSAASVSCGQDSDDAHDAKRPRLAQPQTLLSTPHAWPAVPVYEQGFAYGPPDMMMRHASYVYSPMVPYAQVAQMPGMSYMYNQQ